MNYKPTGSLKAFIAAGKNKTRVLGSVERHVLSKPAGDGRSWQYLHPSDMVSAEWCYRASYYHLLGHEPVQKERGFRIMSVFEEGHAIHNKWQTWLKEMEVLYGKYRCLECGTTFFGLPTDHDPKLHPKDFEYLEVPLLYEPLKIAGHSDGWIRGLGDDMMLEIKSIGVGTLRWEAPELLMDNKNDFDKAWKQINAPFGKHVSQVQLYMKLAELLYPDNHPKEAVIIYEAKPNQEVKEFVVAKSDFQISGILEAAERIVKAVEAKEPLECNIGGSWNCDRCRDYKD